MVPRSFWSVPIRQLPAPERGEAGLRAMPRCRPSTTAYPPLPPRARGARIVRLPAPRPGRDCTRGRRIRPASAATESPGCPRRTETTRRTCPLRVGRGRKPAPRASLLQRNAKRRYGLASRKSTDLSSLGLPGKLTYLRRFSPVADDRIGRGATALTRTGRRELRQAERAQDRQPRSLSLWTTFERIDRGPAHACLRRARRKRAPVPGPDLVFVGSRSGDYRRTETSRHLVRGRSNAFACGA